MSTPESGEQAATEPAAVEFYWRPGCGFCARLRAQLNKTELPVQEVNIWDDPEAAARVRAVASGNEVVPTVFVGPAAMVNPSIDQVLAAVREHAPALAELAEEPAKPGGWRRWLPGG
ncbi:glutaredoxin [Tamaricihabitans halophyticus]|uniref:Glutaredoxin n=1 Tax=Tamaricihabitans halophyticus TaxID=1262583 RepID=A0A4R2R387_9PSEU|nr:glutaredoxin domain-containing protein [Tamaricihabitans halophyticus]TCP56487.1 glutaredoxin [Tamaricihabitans halophyticus]